MCAMVLWPHLSPGNYIAYREEEVRDAWLDAVDAQVGGAEVYALSQNSSTCRVGCTVRQ
jgi:hypothetical protein